MPWSDPGTTSYGGGWASGTSGGGLKNRRYTPRPQAAMGGWPAGPAQPLSSPGMGPGAWTGAIQAFDNYHNSQEATDEQRAAELARQQAEMMHGFRMEELGMSGDLQRELAMMNYWQAGMALPTGEQIERSRGDLQGSLDDYQNYVDNGRYDQDQMNTLSQNAWNQINNSALGSAKTMNNQLASLGLSSNPGASAALGLSGRFAANAERGNVMAGLERENAEARQWGVQGKAGINSQMADYASRPVFRPPSGWTPWGDEGGPGGGGPGQYPYGNGKRPKPRPGGSAYNVGAF